MYPSLLDGIPLSSVAVSSLGSSAQPTVSAPLNASALAVFNQQLNDYANVRDFLMTFTTNLAVTTVNSIRLQASSLAQLTQATNQLTRSTVVLIAPLSFSLSSICLRHIDDRLGEMLPTGHCYSLDGHQSALRRYSNCSYKHRTMCHQCLNGEPDFDSSGKRLY